VIERGQDMELHVVVAGLPQRPVRGQGIDDGYVEVGPTVEDQRRAPHMAELLDVGGGQVLAGPGGTELQGVAVTFEPDGLLAGRDDQGPQAIDVALGDPVRRVECERRLVVLPRGAELALLPERLGEPVLGIGLRAHLEQAAVGLGGVGPLAGGGLRDRLLGELALETRRGGGARCGVDVGEGHGQQNPFGGGKGL